MAVRVPYKRRNKARLLALLAGLALAASVAWLLVNGEDREEGGLESGLEELKNVLDLLTIEYREAMKGNSAPVESEYQVSKNLTDKAIEIYSKLKAGLDKISREDSDLLGRTLEEIRRAVYEREDPGKVEALVEEAVRRINAILDLARSG